MPASSPRRPQAPLQITSRPAQLLFLFLTWTAIYFASLFSPPLLDDADATHAQAAQAMLRSGDWVTLHVNGIRYLEKAPLPYWITALSLRSFGNNAFAAHLPLALTVLGLAALAWLWGNRAFDPLPAASDQTTEPGTRGLTCGTWVRAEPTNPKHHAGFYAALFTLTAAGVFLFTRIFIPDALLSLLLAFTLYASLRALERNSIAWASSAWTALALAVLTKGLVALVFFCGTLGLYLPLSGDARRWRRLHPLLGSCLLFAIAAPWHILAGLRNRGAANSHGFFWFYFVNEHLLRFLGRRSPADYNKLPATLYWSLHLVWLFPWSFFAPAAAVYAWCRRHQWWPLRRLRLASFAHRTALLLVLFSSFVLVFFSLSTNQEYYTFPIYLPILLLTAGALARIEAQGGSNHEDMSVRRTFFFCHIALVALGLLAAVTLAFELWSSRHLPAAHNIGDLLAHRGVGDYTLSMSHVFDLTTASFSALRLPAAMACAALAIGPLLSLVFRIRRQHTAATLTLALMSSAFLIAAHIALVRFAPLLSSQDFAAKIQSLEETGAVDANSEVLLYGDQALGSSIPFYLDRRVELVDGRSTSMLFGSTFPDAPPIFLTHQQLRANWGKGPRKLLFVPLEHRADVNALLGPRAVLLYESSGKALFTDRPVNIPSPNQLDSNSPLPNNR